MAKQADKLAVVTGASTGIGYFLADECAKNGYDLIIAASRPAPFLCLTRACGMKFGVGFSVAPKRHAVLDSH
jgi:short-subunit dehydrogenase